MTVCHESSPARVGDHDRPARGGCGCGGDKPHGVPVLDARAIPRQVRPGTILGALAQLPTGDGLVLVAPHDPRPLLAQIEATNPDRFVVQYLEEGPDAWQLAFTRRRPGDGLT